MARYNKEFKLYCIQCLLENKPFPVVYYDGDQFIDDILKKVGTPFLMSRIWGTFQKCIIFQLCFNPII